MIAVKKLSQWNFSGMEKKHGSETNLISNTQHVI